MNQELTQQSHIVEKYSNPTDKLIGFSVTESVVESDDDDSLLAVVDTEGLIVFVFIRGAKRHYLALTGLLKKKGVTGLMCALSIEKNFAFATATLLSRCGLHAAALAA